MGLPTPTPAWRFYASFYRGHSRPLVFGLLAAGAQTLVALPLILLVRHALDSVVPSGELLPLLAIGATLLGLYVLQSALFLLARHTTLKVTKIAVRALRHELLDTLYQMPGSRYAKADLRRLHTRIVEDSERVDVMSNALLSYLLPSIPPALVLCAVLVWLNPWLAGLTLLVVPLLLLAGRHLRRLLRQRVDSFHGAFEGYSRSVHHSLHLLDLIRSHATEKQERQRHATHTGRLRDASRRMAFLQELHNQIHFVLLSTVAVLVLIAGGYAVSNGFISLGELGAFLMALTLLRTHLQALAGSIAQIIAGERALLSVYAIVAAAEAPAYQGTQRMDFGGRLSLHGVSFAYQSGQPLLKDIELDLVPGQVLALSGANGSGKTTLAQLILGLYRPDSGMLLADGVEYPQLNMQQLRAQIGYAPQRPLLFPGSIAENLRYADPDAEFSALADAARRAAASDFIEALPDGYDTVIGEGGMGLSGGQQQRLGLARALLKRPPLLILDEPTASLDEGTIRAMLAGLRGLEPAPAMLVISHDRRVLEWADACYWLEKGQLSRRTTETTV